MDDRPDALPHGAAHVRREIAVVALSALALAVVLSIAVAPVARPALDLPSFLAGFLAGILVGVALEIGVFPALGVRRGRGD